MQHQCISADVSLGNNVYLASFVNLYGCSIGDNSRIGTFVEIQKNAAIGANCKIQSHSFICEGVQIGVGCFVGHGVVFINDKYPRSTTPDGALQREADWELLPTVVEEGVSIGSGATILCGLTIGHHALVGAGSVVTRDVAPYTIVAGNPAKPLRRIA
jgi:acetyltransferase-like isoleucine patch superfamily enzyme